MSDKDDLPPTWAARAGVRFVDLLYYGGLTYIAVRWLFPAMRGAFFP